MIQKYTAFWRWLLTIYLIYVFIYIFLYYPTWDLTFYLIFVACILFGNALGIFSIYRLTDDNKVRLRPLFRLSIFCLYIFLMIFNTLLFTIGIVTNFAIYYNDIAGLIVITFGLLLPIIALYPVTKVFTSIQLNRKKLLKYLWTGYLWGMWLMLVLAFGNMSLEIRKWTFYDYLVSLSAILLLTGLLSYNFKQAIFPLRFWKVYFYISFLWTIVEFIYYFCGLKDYFVVPNYLKSYAPENEYSLSIYLIFFVLYMPLYIPLYKISFNKNYFKKKLTP